MKVVFMRDLEEKLLIINSLSQVKFEIDEDGIGLAIKRLDCDMTILRVFEGDVLQCGVFLDGVLAGMHGVSKVWQGI